MCRLCNGSNIEPLRVLADTMEPLTDYGRHGSMRYTTEYPLSRVVDVALSDAPDFIKFRLSYNEYIKSKSRDSYSKMMDLLEKWSTNQASFSSLACSNAALKEVLPLSDNLMELASATRKLLVHLNAGIKMEEVECDALKVQIETLKKPIAEMKLPLISITLDIINQLNNGK